MPATYRCMAPDGQVAPGFILCDPAENPSAGMSLPLRSHGELDCGDLRNPQSSRRTEGTMLAILTMIRVIPFPRDRPIS